MVEVGVGVGVGEEVEEGIGEGVAMAIKVVMQIIKDTGITRGGMEIIKVCILITCSTLGFHIIFEFI